MRRCCGAAAEAENLRTQRGRVYGYSNCTNCVYDEQGHLDETRMKKSEIKHLAFESMEI